MGNLKLSFQDEISSSRGFCGVSTTQENVGQFVAANKRRLRFRNPQPAYQTESGRGAEKQQGWGEVAFA
jgi:hypothetical protein